MATIADMAIKLSANAQGLTAGLASATASLKKFASGAIATLDKGLVAATRDVFASVGKAVTDGLGAIPILGGPLAFVAGTLTGIVDTGFGLLDFLRKSWGQMKELGKQASNLGISVSDLSGLMYAAGNSGDVLLSSLFKMNVNLGKARMGSKEASIAFARLGLDVKDLAALNTAERFNAVADAISKIKDPSIQAASAFAVFGKGVGPLLFLLKQGAAGIEEFKKQAAQRGLLFSDDDIKAAREGAKALDQLDRTFAGLKNAFAVAVGPIAAEFLKFINEAASKVGGFPELFKSWAAVAAEALAFITDGFADLIESADGLIKTVTDLGGKLAEVSAIAGTTFAALTLPFRSGRGGALAGGLGLEETGGMAKSAADKVRELGERLREVGAKLKTPPGPPAPMKGGALDDFAALYDRAAKVWDEIRSPQEKFEKAMENLNELVESGIISWDDYSTAAANALGNMEKDLHLGDHKFASAALAGSKEAYSSIVAFRNDQNRQDAQQRIEGVLQQSKAIQEAQLKVARETVDALANISVVGDF
jgi:hypothetical protein